MFLLTLSEWQPNRKPAAEEAGAEPEQEPDESTGDDQPDVGDSRFVVVTDLGIVAKSSQDKTRDVFVQSIQSGAPVSGANVSVVAKNGVTLLSQTTGADGHVRFPALDVYTNERQPVMFWWKRKGMFPSCRPAAITIAGWTSRASMSPVNKRRPIRARSAATCSPIAAFIDRGYFQYWPDHPRRRLARWRPACRCAPKSAIRATS